MHALRRRRRERENRRADIAAELHIMPESAKEMCDQRRCRRLAVGAGNRNARGRWGSFRACAAEELDVADDLDLGLASAFYAPVRLGMGQRNAWRQDQRTEIVPVGKLEFAYRQAFRPRGVAGLLVIVVSRDIGAPRQQRTRRSEPRPAEPK